MKNLLSIVADDIYYQGYKVGTLAQKGIPATIRAQFEKDIEDRDSIVDGAFCQQCGEHI